MKRAHVSVRIVLTEEEAFALEADQAKWPGNWTILSDRRRRSLQRR